MTSPDRKEAQKEPPAMALLRGPLSKRATSAEFNEWQAREIVEYVDHLQRAIAHTENGKG